MKRIIVALVLFGAGLFINKLYQKEETVATGNVATKIASTPNISAALVKPASPALYECDKRSYCSQMTSCEEATYFLQNCAKKRMDGDHDGVPCEQQWCK